MIVPSQKASPIAGDVAAIIAEEKLRSSVTAEVRQRRSSGQPLDARALLDERPELRTRKSIVLELALDEYCQRTEAGESVDLDRFYGRFPEFEESLRRLLEVQQFLDENPDVVPEIEVDWPEPGRDFRGFSVLAEIGRGAFGRVYLAEEIALGRRLVAVKASMDGTLEADILGRVEHPNIVPVYSVKPADQSGLTVVCMPFLGRVTLHDLLDRLFGKKNKKKPLRSRAIIDAIHDASRPMPAGDATGSTDPELCHGSYVDGALHLGVQLAEALAYSHSRGICHSDLKPSNVLVTPGGRPMLVDFNLAFDQEAAALRVGGTLFYMSPEHLSAMDAESTQASGPIDERSDVFSLGVILYELLSGALPFGPVATNRPRAEIIRSLLQCQKRGPRRLRDANKDIDPKLAGIIESCLAFAPDRRPQRASELAAALRRSRSTVRRVERWSRRHCLVALSGGACSLLAGIGTGYHLATRDPCEIRMFNHGGEAYLAADFEEAETSFRRVVELAKSKDLLADAYFWRGRACLKLGRDSEGIHCFAEADKLRPDGRIAACHAYACAHKGFHMDCIRLSQYAIESGFATAEVYNNLGYAYLCESQFAKSIEALGCAIQSKPELLPAYYNRALAEFRASLRQQRAMDARACKDIDNLLNRSREHAHVYYDAAVIYQRVAENSDQSRERIIEYLCRALRLGVHPQLVRRRFPRLLDDERIKRALAMNVPVVQRDNADQLADPVADQPFPFR